MAAGTVTVNRYKLGLGMCLLHLVFTVTIVEFDCSIKMIIVNVLGESEMK